MKRPENLRERALRKLASRGGLAAAEKALGFSGDGDLGDVPPPLLLGLLEVLVRAGESARALSWLERLRKERWSREVRDSALAVAVPLLNTDLPSAGRFLLWRLFAEAGEFDRALGISERFGALPRQELKSFQEACREMRSQPATRSLGDLGIVHLGFAVGQPLGALSSLRRLSVAEPLYASHVRALVDRIPAGAPPAARWVAAEIRFNTGQREEALSELADRLRRDGEEGVKRLDEALERGHLDVREAETLVLRAAELAPGAPALRSWLVDVAVREDRGADALDHLRFLVRGTTDPGDLEGSLDRLAEIADGTEAPALVLRGEILARAGKDAELLGTLRDVLRLSPASVPDLLETRLATGSPEDVPFRALRAEALAALGRPSEALAVLEEMTDRPDAPIEELFAAYGRLEANEPDEPLYRIGTFRLCVRAGRADRALDVLGELMDAGRIEAGRALELLSEAEGAAGLPEGVRGRIRLARVRCFLDLGHPGEALEELEQLGPEDGKHLRAGLSYALRSRPAWVGEAARARRLASLLFLAAMTEEAVGLLDETVQRDPDAAPLLAEVYDEEHVVHHRTPRVLGGACRLLLRAGRHEAAAARAFALGEVGSWEEEHSFLRQLVDSPEARHLVLCRLLDDAFRLDRPQSEKLARLRDLLAEEDLSLLREGWETLKRRQPVDPKEPEFLELRGEIAIRLGEHEDAFLQEKLLADFAPDAAETGLARIVRERPDLDEIRAWLADFRLRRGNTKGALDLLREAPRRTAVMWRLLKTALARGAGPPEAWLLHADWLEAAGKHADLVEQAERMLDKPWVDLEDLEARLARMEEREEVLASALRVRVGIAKRRKDLPDIIGHLGRLLDCTGAVREVLVRLDELAGEYGDRSEYLIADYRLSARSKARERVVEVMRSCLGHPRGQEVVPSMLAHLREPGFDEEFRGHPDFCEAALDLARAGEDGQTARRYWRELTGHYRGRPEARAAAAGRWRETFGIDEAVLSDEIDALLAAGRIGEATPRIRSLSELDGIEWSESRRQVVRDRALRYAERAADDERSDLDACLLASDLSIRADRPRAALAFALRRLAPDVRPAVGDHLLRLRESFPSYATIPYCLAVKVHEPAGQRDLAAAELENLLSLAPGHAGIVLRVAERLARCGPPLVDVLRVRARAATERSRARTLPPARLAGWVRSYFEAAPEEGEAALGLVERHLEGVPHDVPSRLLADEIVRSLGRPEESLRHLGAILENPLDSGTEFEVRRRLADALEALDRYGEALEEWRRCATLDPTAGEVPRRIRENFFRRRRHEAGQVRAGESVRSGFLALWRGRPEEALAAIPAAPPDVAEPTARLALRASTLLALNRPRQSIDELREAVYRLPLNGDLGLYEKELLTSVGMCARAAGDRALALRCLERVAREDAAYRSARRQLDAIYADEARRADPMPEVTTAWEDGRDE